MYGSGKNYRNVLNKITRRHFLKLGVLTTAATLSPFTSLAALREPLPAEKTLCFYNIHTDERLKEVYWRRGQYVPDALQKINMIMRDYRTDEVKKIDVRLLDLLSDIYRRLDSKQSFHIVSGYRTPLTNNYLFKHSTGVNKNSLHMYGKAVDVRVPLCDLSRLANAAKGLKSGGVGYYPDSNFVHVDIGELRTW
jgi:uncharacterized protein YcbK (DUF882 family)